MRALSRLPRRRFRRLKRWPLTSRGPLPFYRRHPCNAAYIRQPPLIRSFGSNTDFVVDGMRRFRSPIKFTRPEEPFGVQNEMDVGRTAIASTSDNPALGPHG